MSEDELSSSETETPSDLSPIFPDHFLGVSGTPGAPPPAPRRLPRPPALTDEQLNCNERLFDPVRRNLGADFSEDYSPPIRVKLEVTAGSSRYVPATPPTRNGRSKKFESGAGAGAGAGSSSSSSSSCVAETPNAQIAQARIDFEDITREFLKRELPKLESKYGSVKQEPLHPPSPEIPSPPKMRRAKRNEVERLRRASPFKPHGEEPLPKRRTGSQHNPIRCYDSSQESFQDEDLGIDEEMVALDMTTEFDDGEESDGCEPEWLLTYGETVERMRKVKQAMGRDHSLLRKRALQREYTSLNKYLKRMKK